MTNADKHLLEVEHLRVGFRTAGTLLEAVSDISFTISEGQVHGIVGESGCGKTVTFLSLLGLLPPNGLVASGQAWFHGRDLLSLPEQEINAVRGKSIAYIPQEPQSALNPVRTIGLQLAEPLVLHEGMSWADARRRARHLLDRVGIPDAEKRLREYPHQLSGGMCQRVLIAMALACRPQLLVADEPTTALDVTVQRQILDLIRELGSEAHVGIVLITHDLGVVAEMCDVVSVMYAGRLVESGPVEHIFSASSHPYTRALLRSLPSLATAGKRLEAIEGVVPSPAEMPTGCRFEPRCPRAKSLCRVEDPKLERRTAAAGLVACHYPVEEHEGATYATH